MTGTRWRITKPLDQPGRPTWSPGRAGSTQRVGHGDWPAVPALRDTASLADALHALARVWLQPHSSVDGGMWSDRSATAAWLVRPPVRSVDCDVMVVVDGNDTMVWWDETVAQFIDLVREQPFRQVRVCRLDTSAPAAEQLVERRNDGHGLPVILAESDHRQVVLVLTDAAASAWHDNEVLPLLRAWGREQPVAVINLVPPASWPQGGLTTLSAELRSPSPGAPNESMIWTPATGADLGSDPSEPGNGCAVPVLALDARWLRTWVGLTAGSAWRRLPIVATSTGASAEPTSADPLFDFRARATPDAFRLATYLAAVPLNVPVMRLVQATMLPTSTPHDLYQVITGGILEVPVSGADPSDPAPMTFDFRPTIREELLGRGGRTDTLRVWATLDRYAGPLVPPVRAIAHVLRDPSSAPLPEATTELRYLRLELALLEALSGPYRARANRLRQLLNESRRPPAPREGSDSSMQRPPVR